MVDLNFELFDSKCSVATNGYEIDTYVKEASELKVTTVLGAKGDIEEGRTYSYIKQVGVEMDTVNLFDLEKSKRLKHGLARVFSELLDDDGALNNKELLSFANKYGLLGINSGVVRNGELPREDVSEWEYWIKSFKRIYSYIDRYDNKGKTGIGRDQAMAFYNNQVSFDLFQTKVIGNSKKYGWHISLEPQNLITAMRILLIKEITDDISTMKCQAPKCSKWFKYRKSKKYCCTVCRVSGNRAMKSK